MESCLSTAESNIKTWWRNFSARLAIRFGFLKKESIETDEINQIINDQLPLEFEIPTPGGDGKLILLGVSFVVDPIKNCIHAELLCNFSVDVKQRLIYNTHLQLTVETGLLFDYETKTIGANDISITELNLISDKYSIMKDATSLISGFLPNTVKSIVNLTLTSTQALLNSKKINAATQYLLLYSSGSKQKIIDYHKSTIETKVRQLIDSPEYRYQLDESNFEENLFARYGKRVSIENGQIYFVFND